MKGFPNEIQRLSQRKCKLSHSWSRHHKVWLLLGVVVVYLSVMMVLSPLDTIPKVQAKSTQPVSTSLTLSDGTRASFLLPTPTIVATTQKATPSLYTASSTNVGLMQPAVDGQGNAWVGEMNTNRLCRLNSHTGQVTTWEPPQAASGIMTTAIDSSGNVWFVEQAANYIGRFDPVRQTFRTFPLGTVHGQTMEPQTLLFDASGSLWFTEISGSIGRLIPSCILIDNSPTRYNEERLPMRDLYLWMQLGINPITGAIQTWPIAGGSPYSLTVTSDGQVWFGNAAKGIGHLDPHTGHVTLFPVADEKAIVFSMAHDTKGHIWFTEISQGKLGMFDPTTNKVTELQVPTPPGTSAWLYGIVVLHNNDVWFANGRANALVRYSPDRAAYTIFQLSTEPYGLTIDSAGMLWFTATGLPSLIGKIMP